MLIYIDDMLIVGKTQAVKDEIQVLQQSFEVKKTTTLGDYLGVQVINSKDGKQAWLGQPTIIKNVKNRFADDVQTLTWTLTPVTEHFMGTKSCRR